MERTQRLVFLVLLIGWTIFRLVRYVRIANSKRPGPAVPPPMGGLPQQPGSAPTAPATGQSPIEAEGRSGASRTGVLAAAVVLIAGSALIWTILFALPAFDAVPPIWRLTVGVLASFFLIRAARVALTRTGSRAPQRQGDDRNPIK